MPGNASTKETSWSGSRKSRDDVDEDKFDRVAAQRGWVGQRRDHARFAVYPSIVLSNRTDGTPHRLVRNGRHKDWVTAWKRQRMEYAPVARATTKGFMERDMKEKERVRRAILSCAGWPISYEFLVVDVVCLWILCPFLSFGPPGGLGSFERIFNALG